MILKGFSKYDVTDENGELKVRALGHNKVILKPTLCDCYRMRDDDKTARKLTQGHIRFLMRHPDIDGRLFRPVDQKIRFSPTGEVINLHDPGYIKKDFSVFRDIDDVLETVLIMKAAADGDVTFIYPLIESFKKNAVNTVRFFGGPRPPVKVLRESLEDAGELFMETIKECNFRKILPLYARFCSCLITAAGKKSKTLPFKDTLRVQKSIENF